MLQTTIWKEGVIVLIIVDNKTPAEAKKRLAFYGELLALETNAITYPAISGHPDIFFCPTPQGIVVAPNLPFHYLRELEKHQIIYLAGTKAVGSTYPNSATYNAATTSGYFIHNIRHSDPALLAACASLTHIHVNQAYTRCNLFALDNDLFITSDSGIEKTLCRRQLQCFYLSPTGIYLQGHRHGFIGGACGCWQKKVFLCGSLRHYVWGKKFRELVEEKGYEVVELFDGPLYDIGTILFADSAE